MATDSVLNIKATELENIIPDNSQEEFNRSTKISFDARMKEAEKNLASKTEVNNALDLGDKYIK